MTRVVASIALAWFALGQIHAQTSPRPFADGDVICFLGDSITAGGAWHKFIADFYATRFPTRTIKTINCGVGGGTAANALERFEWDVLVHRPTVIVVMLGMNDIGASAYNGPDPSPAVAAARQASLAAFRANMTALLTAIRAKSKARVVLVKPSPYDETVQLPNQPRRGANAALAECGIFCEKLAQGFGAEVVDFHGPMTKLNAEGQKIDPKFTLCGPDRVHAGANGQLVMAALFLQAQGLARPVASIALDARTNVVKADNATVGELAAKEGKWTFVVTENALPFVSGVVDPVLAKLMPVEKMLNDESLRVSGLPAGQFRLSVDGVVLGAYFAGEWERGVNVAAMAAAPQVTQAVEIAKIGTGIFEHGKAQRTIVRMKKMAGGAVDCDDESAFKTWADQRMRSFKPESPEAKAWRGEVARFLDAKSKAAAAWDAIDKMRAEIDRKNKPKAHTWTLEKTPD